MRREGWAVIYGLIITILVVNSDLLLAELFNVDVVILFLCDIIFILAMIWHYITTGINND